MLRIKHVILFITVLTILLGCKEEKVAGCDSHGSSGEKNPHCITDSTPAPMPAPAPTPVVNSIVTKSTLFFSRWGNVNVDTTVDLYTNGRGTGMAIVGDVNNDGYDDLAVGAPFSNDHGLVREGRVDVFSGKDRSLLFSIYGGAAYVSFGNQLAGVGDVNHDGFADFLVSAWGTSGFGQHRKVFLFSGQTRLPLFTVQPAHTSGCFGNALAEVGDQNQDNIPDFLIADACESNGAGEVKLYSGSNLAVLSTFSGTGEFGFTVGSAKDIDKDGRTDFFISSRFQEKVFVYSGSTKQIIKTFSSPNLAPGFGYGMQVDSAGDFDGDTYADIIVGDAGTFYVYSGRDDSILFERTLTSRNYDNVAVAGLGDYNGDGRDDIAISSPLDNKVFIYSGLDSSIIDIIEPSEGTNYFGTGIIRQPPTPGYSLNKIIVSTNSHAEFDSNRRQIGASANGKIFEYGFFTPYSQISSGGNSTCGITQSGVLKCWGIPLVGSSNLTSSSFILSPTTVDSGVLYSSVSVGNNGGYPHACGITQSGVLKCWGANGSGQLGDGTLISRTSPVTIDSGTSYKSVAVGGNGSEAHSCGITTAGILKCWGNDRVMATGTTVHRLTPSIIDTSMSYSSVTVGDTYTCAINSVEVLKCWGTSYHGQSQSIATVVDPGTAYKSVTASYTAVCGITNANELKCWGTGHLGSGAYSASQSTPIIIDSGTSYRNVSVGPAAICGITLTNSLKCWGVNSWGEVGNGSLVAQTTPLRIDAGTLYGSISVGSAQTCGITTGGLAKCWGSNNAGQLGDGTTSIKLTPTAVVQ